MPRWDRGRNRVYRDEFNRQRRNVRPENVGGAANRGRAKVNEFGDIPPGSLAKFWIDIKDMIALIRDYARGNYRDVPWGSIAAITAAVLYFINPIDLIPDMIPIAGYIDDAAVIAVALKFIGKDLDRYRAWQKKQEEIHLHQEEIVDVDFEEIK